MTQLILHHYDFSNFSEKIRLIFGFKNLQWCSVEIPSHLPKPDYTPLTLGYRRTPALQIGADIYCDTGLIARELEKRFPQPSLYKPMGNLEKGLNQQESSRVHTTSECLAHWAEGPLLWPAALYVTGVNAEKFPDSFHADRAKLHNKPKANVEQIKRAGLRYFTEMKVQLERIEILLSHGEHFILGDSPCLADLIVYGAPWLLETLGGPSDVIDKLPNTRAWLARIAKIGQGEHTPMSADTAIKIANESAPMPVEKTQMLPTDFNIGEQVKVSPRDEYSPAAGRLIAVDETQIVISGGNDRVSNVHVHFPRLGYRISRNKSA